MNKTRKHVLGSGDNIFLLWNTFINLEWATSGGGESAAKMESFVHAKSRPFTAFKRVFRDK
jgi:hypothetical protein